VLPGFGLTFGITVLMLGLVVLLPLSVLVIKAGALGPSRILAVISGRQALAAYRVSFLSSFEAALANVAIGTLVAWVLERYRFPGRGLIDALVDIPFALPTAVAGIALTTVYAPNGLVGRYFDAVGIKVAFAPLGVTLALTFVGLPFVVRSVQPVLHDLDPSVEEAAAVLGAGRLRTFVYVLLPAILPAILAGFGLAFARALGEYGSVVFISGNLPLKTEIVPLLIVNKLEQYDYGGATALATVMLGASFLILLGVNALEARTRRAHGAA
jgi:sulfate transport system permease protein